MKSSSKKEINSVLHPKDNSDFIGHASAIEMLYNTSISGRIPQSWLFTGAKGIGKASLAYRFARHLLASGNDKNLYIAPDNATFKRISSNSHSDLLVIEPDEGSASGEIKVDNIRKVNDFLRMTSSETGRRIVIIDSADDMNINAANALLKLLEEPPAGAMFILISHSPGRLLPTIKSRCRQLRLMPLSNDDNVTILNRHIDSCSLSAMKKLSMLANGSAGMAITLHNNSGLEIYSYIVEALKPLPKKNLAAIQKLSDMVTKKDDRQLWDVFAYVIDFFIMNIIRAIGAQKQGIEIEGGELEIKNKLLVEKSLAELIKIWEKINSLISDTDRVNLDKKAVIISIFEEF